MLQGKARDHEKVQIFLEGVKFIFKLNWIIDCKFNQLYLKETQFTTSAISHYALYRGSLLYSVIIDGDCDACIVSFGLIWYYQMMHALQLSLF